MKNQKKQGFTLVEIMIVVMIIGLLAAIALPSFQKARDSAREKSCINNLRLIQSAKDQYAIDANQPDTTQPTVADIEDYIKNGMPTCPVTGTNTYTISAITTDPTCSNDGEGHSVDGGLQN